MPPEQQFWVEITKIVLIILIFIIAIYDGCLMYKYGREPTISNTIYLISKEWPIVPVGVGMVIGHVFWR